MRYVPRHRRCLRWSHHVWVRPRRTLLGWTVLECANCDEVEIG